MQAKQTSFKFKETKPGTKAYIVDKLLAYGGRIQYRKKPRPFRKNRSVHLILRSKHLAGSRSLLKQNRSEWLSETLKKKAKKYGAKLYNHSVNSNHVHILIRFVSPKLQAAFIKDFAGTVALKIKRTFKISEKIWDERPFSRIVKKGAYPFINRYVVKNTNEASGAWAYTSRPLSELIRILTSTA